MSSNMVLQWAFDAGTRLVVFDNAYVNGSSTPIFRRSSAGDTHQLQTLSDGSTYEVPKNFPSERELKLALGWCCREAAVARAGYFWLSTGVIDA